MQHSGNALPLGICGDMSEKRHPRLNRQSLRCTSSKMSGKERGEADNQGQDQTTRFLDCTDTP